MSDFRKMLLRLKEQLGVETDKQAAEFLGLSATALGERKRRGAFPGDKLLALIARRPDLGLDFDYITTGTTFVDAKGDVMTTFEAALGRLKEQLGVETDREVAGLLGLTDKALNARKRRGAFPDDKLLALIARRPDLGLDFDYITTGARGLAELAAEEAPEHHRSPGKMGIGLSLQEEKLIGLYRRTTAAGRAAILSAAEAIAAKLKP